MRNDREPRIRRIISLAGKLPYFAFDDLASVEKDRIYLKILLHRYEKSGKLIRLKKGLYVSKEYIDGIQKAGAFSAYGEFLSYIIYQPSYLSLDYVLYEHNLLTEIPRNFTSVTKKKTARFSCAPGNFYYHKIKDELFCGFEIIKRNSFIIYKATMAKALFDYLYFRKNHLIGRDAVEELRLNLDDLSRSDVGELQKYIKMEGSKKMEEIFFHLKSLWKK